MNRNLRILTAVVGAVALWATTVLGAFAQAPGAHRAPGVALSSEKALAAAAKCGTKMEVSEVAWVTLDEDDEIEEQVESYPSGTMLIVPVFQYNCVPKKATIVTVFTYNGEEVYSDKETLPATKQEGLYGYPLLYGDDEPFPDGEWGVEFYNNKTLLVSGAILLGDEAVDTELVTVQGVITDKKTRKPIKGATILFLVPEVTVESWLEGAQAEEEVYTGGQSDSKGEFVLELRLEREVEYSVIVVARRYKPIGQDGFVVTADDPNPLDLNIKMTK